MGRFWNQTEALFKKNLIYQKRHPRSIAWILLIPAVLFGILFGVKIHDHKKYEIDPARMPVESFPVLAIPPNWYRAVKTKEMPHDDLPDASCRKEDGSCPATFLITGKNRTFAESLAGNMYTNSSILNSTDAINIADGVWGTDNGPVHIDRISEVSLYAIESVCSYKSTKSLHAKIGDKDMAVKATCLQGLHLWRENYREINKELQGYYYERDSIMEKTNGIAAAYDFLDSNASRLNAHVWYNPTLKSWLMAVEVLEGVQAVLSTAWNAYLQFLKGPSIKMILEYVGEMGTPAGGKDPDMASEYAYFFFTWIFLQIFPVTLSSVVYEKQHRIRIMMKMHGLGDGAYWLITYSYFFVVGLIYMLQLVLLGSLSGLPFFSMNSYALQILFYRIHMNLLIISAFILSGLFSSTKSASVAAYSLLFGTWICSETLFRRLIIDASFPRAYLVILELFPGFSLYRGIYEFQTYGLKAREMGTYGMRWRILRDKGSGIREVMIIVLAEWLFFLFIFALGNGFLKRLLSFTRKPRKSPSLPNHGSQDQDCRVLVQLDKQDIDQEKERVIELLGLRHPGYPIIADNLMKVYPGKHGAPEKYAVRGLSLAVARGECFGLLGPNGAGKTSFLNMMTGLAKPSSGTAIIGGRDLQKQMHKIYKSMGVCPQFNLLWDSLTGREHLQFYGRLKNLIGPYLNQAIEDSLRNANLLQDADNQAGKYSGGMKRRLSVAISLIGDPKVVYMDEPGTGLDPASRDMLWDAVEKAKQDRAILLTTHSMEEAERLCDRIGIIVDGSIRCIGSPEQLKERYGGAYIFTMTTSQENEKKVESLARRLCPKAKKVYNISGTQKFELPKEKVKLSDVFKAVAYARTRFEVRAWEISETTLEDVFINVASYWSEGQHSTV